MLEPNPQESEEVKKTIFKNMETSLQTLKKFIREELGRNYHTTQADSYTFEDFQDYDVQIDGSNQSGFFLTIYFLDDKIYPTQRFESYSDAHHASRMVIDKDRVNRMNHGKKKN